MQINSEGISKVYEDGGETELIHSFTKPQKKAARRFLQAMGVRVIRINDKVVKELLKGSLRHINT